MYLQAVLVISMTPTEHVAIHVIKVSQIILPNPSHVSALASYVNNNCSAIL